MTRFERSLLAVVSAVACAGPLAAADAVQLRPLAAPVYVAEDGSGMLSPEGVGCGPATLLVADSGHSRILRYSMGNDDIRATSRYELPQIPSPIRAVLHPSGTILALDGKQRRVGKIGTDGAFAGYLDVRGADEPMLRSIAVGEAGGDDSIYLLDLGGARVLVVDLAGELRRTIALPADHGFPADVAVDRAGGVFVLDSVKRRVFRAAVGEDTFAVFAGDLDDVLVFPLGIAADAAGRLYLADAHDGAVVVLGRDGGFRGRHSRMGWGPGLLRYPSGLCVLDDGYVVVADRGNNRVQLFAISE